MSEAITLRVASDAHRVRCAAAASSFRRFSKDAARSWCGCSNLGMRANVHARASCRAILAQRPEAERKHLLPARSLRKLTEYTITDRRALRAELAWVIEQGYAVERNEYQLGVGCLAAPCFNRTGAVAGSLAVSMPVARLNEDERGIATVVMSCAHAAGYPQVRTEVSAA